MASSLGIRRAVVGLAAIGLLAGGATLGMSGTANAAPAPTSAATVVTGDQHDRCEWKKGHWEKKWVKGHWEKKWYEDKTWNHGQWDHDWSYKWAYVHGHWDHVWEKGHWDCRH